MRVSSAAITSTVARMSSARNVTSRRLPSGVATTYNDPAHGARRPASPPFAPTRSESSASSASPISAIVPAAAFTRIALATMLGVALAGVAAFSAAQTPPASDAAPPEPPAPRPPAPVDIALILPLDAPAYARAADAVRAGFLAAAEAAGAQSAGEASTRMARMAC